MLNKIIIMGRLGKDPELRHTQSGTPVASFSLAVDRDFKDKGTGERVVADNVYFGDSKKDGDGGYQQGGYPQGGSYQQSGYPPQDGYQQSGYSGGYSGGYGGPPNQGPPGYPASDYNGFQEAEEDDGDLPF